MNPLRFGVVGFGAMGRRHARAIGRTDGVELVVVADPSAAARVEPAPGGRGPAGDVPVVASLRALLEFGLDACVVASPTPDHVDSAVRCAGAGLHVLIEKPMALDGDGCARIVAAFSRSGTIGAVGHVERFHPAALELRGRLGAWGPGALRRIDTRREGGPPRRVDGGPVLLDLGTHDFDLVSWLTGERYETATVRSRPATGAPLGEAAIVEAVFPGGLEVRHSLSRRSSVPVRRATASCHDGSVLVADTLDTGSADPLSAQVAAFRDLIAGRLEAGDARAPTSLDDGARVVRLAAALMAPAGNRPAGESGRGGRS